MVPRGWVDPVFRRSIFPELSQRLNPPRERRWMSDTGTKAVARRRSPGNGRLGRGLLETREKRHQSGCRAFRETRSGRPGRSSRGSRVAHQPEDRCEGAIDRAILYPFVGSGTAGFSEGGSNRPTHEPDSKTGGRRCRPRLSVQVSSVPGPCVARQERWSRSGWRRCGGCHLLRSTLPESGCRFSTCTSYSAG